MNTLSTRISKLIPQRSLLCHLEPIGLGTIFVESLSSYFQRLADQHSIRPDVLAKYIISPELNKINENFVHDITYISKPSLFNGMGYTPRQWCLVLEQLTSASMLRHLTLVPFEGLFHWRGCLSQLRRWCPKCLFEAEKTRIPYGQLLWDIESVKACPRHGNLLISHHGCKLKDALPPYTAKHLPHLCRWCGQSLAISPRDMLPLAEDQDVQYAKTIGNLLSDSTHFETSQIKNRSFADFLFDAIRFHDGSNGNRTALRIGASTGDVFSWLHKEKLPGLQQAAMVAHAYGVPLAKILNGKGEPTLNDEFLSNLSEQSNICSTEGTHSTGSIEVQLWHYLLMQNPPHLPVIAKALAVSSAKLKRLQPELVRALTKYHARKC